MPIVDPPTREDWLKYKRVVEALGPPIVSEGGKFYGYLPAKAQLDDGGDPPLPRYNDYGKRVCEHRLLIPATAFLLHKDVVFWCERAYGHEGRHQRHGRTWDQFGEYWRVDNERGTLYF